jgi:hypothetical protein
MHYLHYLLYLRELMSVYLSFHADQTSFLSLEAFARICVSGFLFDPDISMNSLFQSPFAEGTDHFPATPAGAPNSAVTRSGSLSQGQLQRGTSITKRFAKFKVTLLRPFTLKPYDATSPYPHLPQGSEATLTNVPAAPPHKIADRALNTAQNVHTAIRDVSRPTFLSRALRSDNPDAISLPFRLSITHIHDKAHRHVPYLRQSWSRIDFIAIVSFWITFVLAMTGQERGTYHIGIFRAMSVIRTARLLTITSGTTVSHLRHSRSWAHA